MNAMTTDTSTPTTTETTRVTKRKSSLAARAFGLEGEGWMRHTNPASVWTRFAALPALALSVWSRTWIDEWSLIPVGLSIVWMAVNPLFFGPPRSTASWASRSVLGERIWTESDRADLPVQFRSSMPTVAASFQSLGVMALAYGLWEMQALVAVLGLLMVQGGKVWYLDRMVLLYDEMRNRDPEYASWHRSR